MKDLLYLKDDQIKEFIQLLYYAYRETFSDPKEILSKKFFGPAHLRALNLIERNPGINLGELIFKLKVTKQSLNRVLRDLLKSRMIKQIQDDNDTRKKNIFLDKEGKVLVACQVGRRQIMSLKQLLINFFTHPMMTFKIMISIHYEALRLWKKGAIFKKRQVKIKNNISLEK